MQALNCSFPPPALFSAETLVGVIFLLTLALILIGALLAVGSHNLVRSVAGLAVAFTGLAGLYYFLLSPFLAMMQLLIYVGAVSVLIAFGIMMATPEEKRIRGKRSANALAGPLAFSVAALFFAAFSILGLATKWPNFPKQSGMGIKELGLALLGSHALVFELISFVLLLAILGAIVLAQRGRS